MNSKYIQTYMDIAERWAQESSAIKLKVGAVIVSGDAMVVGYNGTPEGWDNECEYKVWMHPDAGQTFSPAEIEEQWPFVGEEGEPVIIHGKYYPEITRGRYYLKTKDEVLHAEMNSISKLAKSTLSGVDAILFCTHNPCINCAKAIYQAGIREVYYKNDYRLDEGIHFLEKAGVKIKKV